MTSSARETYLDKMDARVLEYAATAHALRTRMANVGQEVRKRIEHELERYERLEQALRQALISLRTCRDDSYIELRHEADRYWEMLKGALKELSLSVSFAAAKKTTY